MEGYSIGYLIFDLPELFISALANFAQVLMTPLDDVADWFVDLFVFMLEGIRDVLLFFSGGEGNSLTTYINNITTDMDALGDLPVIAAIAVMLVVLVLFFTLVRLILNFVDVIIPI